MLDLVVLVHKYGSQYLIVELLEVISATPASRGICIEITMGRLILFGLWRIFNRTHHVWMAELLILGGHGVSLLSLFDERLLIVRLVNSRLFVIKLEPV